MAGASIKVISASAGSGKTYRLSEVIFEHIRDGVRPEGVVATTFTRKAAAELTERVRRRLIEKGLTREAQRMSAARMGTVHSVCGGLVSDFAFELGLFPDVNILDEDQVKAQFKRALSASTDLTAQQELAVLDHRFGGFDWSAAAQEIVEKARANGLAPDALEDCKKRSVQMCLDLLDKPLRPGVLEQELRQALNDFLQQVDIGLDKTKGTATAVKSAEQYLARLESKALLTWPDWAKLGKIGATKKSDHLLDPVRDIANRHLADPQLHHDLTRAIELVFDLAQAGYNQFQNLKRYWGALDFADQEFLALRLLEREEVCQRISQELELLVVDEFQDTSPIQLAILLKLAEVCGKAVWVGDQKQSIFGFRDTDPALMDACIDQLGKDAATETLPKSWRSRPGLVELSSQVFARAFAGHGMPEELVRLAPAIENEPHGLGPFLERWQTEGTVANQNAGLAASLAELLGDPEARVRDRASGEARQVRPSDIGILCRTTNRAGQVADALAEAGIKAELGRTGLMTTPEARLILAGLRLWVDGRDRLAAAELARLVHYTQDPDQWLAEVLDDRGQSFFQLPEVVEIRRLVGDNTLAGPLLALDLVMDAVKAREFCIGWGEPEVRLANLEAVRSYALTYAQGALEKGSGTTPAGLVAHLEELAEAELDSQGTDPARQAVTISTWHRAKGLEWPVTVLYELGKMWEASTDGVTVLSDQKEFDLKAPLNGRWVRYMPYPYGGLSSGIEILDRIKAHPEWHTRNERERRQALRLLYVGWTRARDRLVLAGKEGELEQGAMALIADNEAPLLSEPENGHVKWAVMTADCLVRTPAPVDSANIAPEPGEDYTIPGPRQYPPARVSPSSIEGLGKVLEQIPIGSRMTLGGKAEPIQLGEVLHTFFAADRNDFRHQDRLSMAESILSRWGIPDALKPMEMIAASDALLNWISKRWPGAELHREWPVWQRLADGSMLAGQADLVVIADDGFAVIDHKALLGNLEQAVDHAKGYAGQLTAYEEAIAKATEKKCFGLFIHMPISGRALSLAQ